MKTENEIQAQEKEACVDAMLQRYSVWPTSATVRKTKPRTKHLHMHTGKDNADKHLEHCCGH